MSLIVFVGPSRIGKTFAMREWMLPALLARPGEVTSMAPAGGYGAVLIHDPPTTERPDGQYAVGTCYQDVAEWKRAEKRPRVARFVNPSLDSLCAAAVEHGRLVICLDEANRLIGNERKPSKPAAELIESGRHHGSMIIGAARRLKALHTSARSNIEVGYFGNFADDDDREDAANAANVNPDRLRSLPPYTFLEWRRETGDCTLIRIENRRKIVFDKLS